METNDFAKQVEAGTKQIVEGSGLEYEPTVFYDSDKQQAIPSKEEQEQFSATLVGQINEGTMQTKEYNAWYEKEYGSKNQHVASNSVSL